MPEISTRVLTAEDFRWSYRESTPSFQLGKWGVTSNCDPFPGYSHDEGLVQETAAQVAECWAPGTDVVYVLSPLEEIGRTNGFSCRGDEKRVYDEDQNLTSFNYTGFIWFSGKRIPPHPGLTRYLVAHEYGHHVEWWIEHQRDLGVDRGELIKEYMELRGIDNNLWNHGGKWHAAAAEIFANDFRVLVCDIENEYWPHPGIAHPNTFGPNSDVWRWWADALDHAGELKQTENVSG